MDGLIICSKAIPDEHLLSVQEPLILCQHTDTAGLSSISNPHREAFRHGLDYLIEKGHRKIAISLARKKGKNSQVRIAAYKEALKKIGQPYREELVVEKALTALTEKLFFIDGRAGMTNRLRCLRRMIKCPPVFTLKPKQTGQEFRKSLRF